MFVIVINATTLCVLNDDFKNKRTHSLFNIFNTLYFSYIILQQKLIKSMVFKCLSQTVISVFLGSGLYRLGTFACITLKDVINILTICKE